MKLSEVFRKAAELCVTKRMTYDEAIDIACGRSDSDRHISHFENFFGWAHFEEDNDHRVLALCMAAAIAESEDI